MLLALTHIHTHTAFVFLSPLFTTIFLICSFLLSVLLISSCVVSFCCSSSLSSLSLLLLLLLLRAPRGAPCGSVVEAFLLRPQPGSSPPPGWSSGSSSPPVLLPPTPPQKLAHLWPGARRVPSRSAMLQLHPLVKGQLRVYSARPVVGSDVSACCLSLDCQSELM